VLCATGGCAQIFARVRGRDRDERQGVCELVVGGAEHPEPGVPADAVVEALDVLKDLRGQLAPGRPGGAVHELFLERGEEALGDGIRLRCRLRLIGALRSELSV
jgi:hypothetical protein